MKTPGRAPTTVLILAAVLASTGCAQNHRPATAASTVGAPATRPDIPPAARSDGTPPPPAPTPAAPPAPPRPPMVGRYQPLSSPGGAITILDTTTGTVWTYAPERAGRMGWSRITLPAGEPGGEP